MKLHSLRRFLVLLLAVVPAAFLTSCGGGGATSTGNPPTGGLVDILPNAGTLYAGIPVTFQLVGGRPPYTVSSSEPSLLPFPLRVDGHSFTVVPNNPGVIDADLEEDELPSRTVNIFVRDATGDLRTRQLSVAQNFLTGYGIIITPTTCPGELEVSGAPADACVGGVSAVLMQATFGGNLFGDEPFRFEVLRGNYSLRNPATGQLSQSVTLNSDHTGTVVGPFIEVPNGVPTQLAVIRVIHVRTGVYADHVFTIGGPPNPTAITALPDTFTFTGPLVGICGTGVGDFFVFDGTPPYTAVSSNPSVTVTPAVSSANPARFTVTASNSSVPCQDATIIVTDANGLRDTVTVNSEEGDTEPPEPPEPADLVVGPTSITLGCAQAGSVTVAGGRGTYAVNSTNPNITATVSGQTVTITRAGPAGAGSGTLNATVSITDGTEIVTVAVTAPATCP